MLNFSDDQAPKGNKGALLWKFVMDHIVNSRKERRKSVSGLVNRYISNVSLLIKDFF